MADNKYNFRQLPWDKMGLKHPSKRVVKKAVIRYVREMILRYGWEETEKRIKEKNFN